MANSARLIFCDDKEWCQKEHQQPAKRNGNHDRAPFGLDLSQNPLQHRFLRKRGRLNGQVSHELSSIALEGSQLMFTLSSQVIRRSRLVGRL